LETAETETRVKAEMKSLNQMQISNRKDDVEVVELLSDTSLFQVIVDEGEARCSPQLQRAVRPRAPSSFPKIVVPF
jgi:hypothetical protein